MKLPCGNTLELCVNFFPRDSGHGRDLGRILILYGHVVRRDYRRESSSEDQNSHDDQSEQRGFRAGKTLESREKAEGRAGKRDHRIVGWIDHMFIAGPVTSPVGTTFFVFEKVVPIRA